MIQTNTENSIGVTSSKSMEGLEPGRWVWLKHPLVVSMMALGVTVLVIGGAGLWMTEGNFTYVQDDAYIHLAMANTLVLEGVWGIDARGFTSSSSSLLWTLLVAGIQRVLGDGYYVPLVLNLLSAGGVLYAAYRALMKYTGSVRFTRWALLGIVFLVPLPALIFVGMEHTLQMLINVGLVFLAATLLGKERISHRQLACLFLLSSLATLIRYEGAFLVVIVAGLFLARKRVWVAVGTLFFGALPVVIYGWASASRGWFFLPNTVLLKKKNVAWTVRGLWRFAEGFVHQFFRTDSFHVYLLLGLVAGSLVYRLRKGQSLWRPLNSLLAITTGTMFVHLVSARQGGFFRYEAYLMVLGLLVLSFSVYDYFPHRVARVFEKGGRPNFRGMGIMFLLMAVVLVGRSLVALSWTPQASRNIYQQQCQMARFAQRYYAGKPVAVNDIGAMAYFSGSHVIDLCGLADLESAKIWRQHRPREEDLARLTREKGMELAIIYDHWFRHSIPRQWVRAGQWTISGNVVCSGDHVSFYAPDAEKAKKLRRQLHEFAPELPKGVGSVIIE
ncbi:MAG: hypothetical protein WC975_05640 [Phycisphaerae bacterium]